MGKAQVVRRFAVPAERLWELVSWRGMEKLSDGALFGTIVFEDDSDRPGATKWIGVGAGRIRERLEWVDPVDFAYGYRIIDTGPLPITDYVGDLRITPAGPDSCVIVIRNSFVAVETDDESWAAEWQRMETGLLEEIAQRLEAGQAALS